VKAILQKISDSLKSGNVTLKTLFEKLDANSSGTVDREEFVYGLMATMNLETLKLQDYSMLFAALDLNNQGHLSLNQFGLFLEGAKISKLQRMNELDASLVDEMRREAESLFKTFD
jgi:Ca2+-binding EF-hand superfamily protein